MTGFGNGMRLGAGRVGLALALLVCGAATGAQGGETAGPLVLKDAGCTATFGNGRIVVGDAQGKPLLEIRGLRFAWSSPVATIGSVAPDGDGALVDFAIDKDETGQVALQARFVCKDGTVRGDFRLAAPDTVKTGGIMLQRAPAVRGSGIAGKIHRGALWTRDPRGGEAYEVPADTLRQLVGEESAVWEVIRGNAAWSDGGSQHLAFKRVKAEAPAAGADAPRDAILDLERQEAEQARRAAEAAAEKGLLAYTATCEFVVTPGDREVEAVVARRAGHVGAVLLTTEQPFNLWETGAGAPSFTTSFLPGRAEGAERVRTVVRDFDGNVLLDKTETAAAGAPRSDFAYALPDAGAGMYFVESEVVGSSPRAFASTMLAVKEPYAYRHREDGIFGIAAFFNIPSREAAVDLLKTMGVRWIRSDHGKPFPDAGAFGVNYHNQYQPAKFATPEARRELFEKTLKGCDERGNVYWEFGNEAKIHQGDRVRDYVDNWLEPIAKFREANGIKTKMMSIGFANGFGGVQSLRAVHKAGGWPLLDAVAYHLGRGNITPDAVKGVRTVDGVPVGEDVGTWNFLPSLLAAKKAIKELGDKPLHITEAYACTKPNSWWHDSLRIAADSVLLSHVLALAEGVEGMHWYQLHDGVWHNVGGVNAVDPEYHFGILRRDGTPKPSLLAYCAAARALDGARFQGYLKSKENTLRGAHFSTPDGPMTVLWDRIEGSVNSKKSDDFLWPDPWVAHYRKAVDHAFAAAGDGVKVVDAIGRSRTVKAGDGKVVLALGGSPVVVYGLKVDPAGLSASLAE